MLIACAGLLTFSACKFREADDFNAEAAYHVCQFNRLCGPENSTSDLFEYAEGDACNEDFEMQHLECPERCDYSPRRARQCIRNLEKMVDSCDITARAMEPCQDVYDCRSSDDPTLIDACGFAYSDGTCLCNAKSDRAGPATLLLSLFGLLWLRRRER